MRDGALAKPRLKEQRCCLLVLPTYDALKDTKERFNMAVCLREKSCPQEHTEVLSTMETAPPPWQDGFISNMAKHFGFQESPPEKKGGRG